VLEGELQGLSVIFKKKSW